MSLSSFLQFVIREEIGHAEGTKLKEVNCAHCGCEYVYRMRCQVKAKVISIVIAEAELAKQEAVAKLNRTLERGCALAPCPQCAKYQPDMVRNLKRKRHRWLFRASLILLGVSAFFVFLGYLFPLWEDNPAAPVYPAPRTLFNAAKGVFGFALMLPLLKWLWASQFDPNAHSEEKRRELSKSVACGRAEFEKGTVIIADAIF